MAASDNPYVLIPPNNIDDPEGHQREVPIVNIDDGDQETLEDGYEEPPNGVNDEPEDEAPEEDRGDEPLADEDEGLDVSVGEDTHRAIAVRF